MPIVEPELMIEGSHDIKASASDTNSGRCMAACVCISAMVCCCCHWAFTVCNLFLCTPPCMLMPGFVSEETSCSSCHIKSSSAAVRCAYVLPISVPAGEATCQGATAARMSSKA